MLVTAKRLWLRHLRQWLHNGLRRRQRRLYRARTARPRLATLVTLTASTEILRAHLYGAYDTLRARNNARLHAKCMHRLTRRSLCSIRTVRFTITVRRNTMNERCGGRK